MADLFIELLGACAKNLQLAGITDAIDTLVGHKKGNLEIEIGQVETTMFKLAFGKQ